MAEDISIAILGYGTVGSGIVSVLESNRDSIAIKAGKGINVKYVFDIRNFPGDPIEKKLTHEFETILDDPEIKIVAEVMGGIEPAYTFTSKLLAAGKSVITSNKELVACHGAKLIKLAKENNCNYTFEASVGGGIPIIRPLNTSFSAEKIESISGILNGTTNYILTKMADEGKTFEEALSEAQEMGYAERNPEADIKGFDTVRKITILASLALSKSVNSDDIYTEGIEAITPADMAYIKTLGSSLKLIGSYKATPKGVYAMVSPKIIPAGHPLSMVKDAYNAVFVQGNMVGNTMFYGSGAGKLPTASACVADIIDAARHPDINVRIDWDEEKVELLPIKDIPMRALIRVECDDIAEGRKVAQSLFQGCRVLALCELTGEFAIITGLETEGLIQEKCKILYEIPFIRGVANIIRMEE